MPMIPPTSGGSSSHDGPYIPCPAGLQQLVCCDVIDLGIVTSTYPGEKDKQVHKVQLRWQSANRMKTGKPYLIQKRYTFSLHEKATLRKDINAWRGKALTDDEAKVFDLEKLIGKNCFANVVHTRRKSKTYADVVAVMPCPRGTAPLVIDGYVRQTAKEAAAAQDAEAEQDGHGEAYEPPSEPQPGDDDFTPDF